MIDARLILPALEAARRALQSLDDDHVPADLRRVVATSGGRLPKPLENQLIERLEELPWLRAKAIEVGAMETGEVARESDANQPTASELFLTRPDGWLERIEAMVAARDQVDAVREIGKVKAANKKALAQLADVGQKLASATQEIKRISQLPADDAERRRLLGLVRELRTQITAHGRSLADARARIEVLEVMLAEADRRIEELRKRRLPKGDSIAQPRGALVFGAGDPLALAQSLDRLMDSLSGTGGPEPAHRSDVVLGLAPGIRPDGVAAIDWLLAIRRPVTLLIDGYNVAFLLNPNPDSPTRRRVEEAGARLRRLAEGPLTVVVYWDSHVDEGSWRTSGIDVRYVESADQSIVEIARPGTVVVTSDRAVREACEVKGGIGLWSQALAGWIIR